MKIRVNKDGSGDVPAEADRAALSRRWKWVLGACAVLSFAALMGVRPHQTVPLPSGAVAFQDSGIFLVPGPGWAVISSGGYTRVKNICLPVLEGTGPFAGAMIEVLASRDFPGDPRKMADNLVGGLRGDPNVVKDSVRREEFTSATGLSGVHLWCRILVQDVDRKGEVVAHCYLVANASGRCVRLNLTTAPGQDWGTADEMIRKTVAAW